MITREGMETAMLMNALLFQVKALNITAGALGGTNPNANITQYHLFVKAGTLLFDVAIPSAQPDAGTAQNRAQQVAKLVISRL